jgi:hypothetical protein
MVVGYKRTATLLHCSKAGEIILRLGNEIISWGSAKCERTYDNSTQKVRKFRIQNQLVKKAIVSKIKVDKPLEYS